MLYNEILGSSRGMTQSGQGGDFYRDCFASLAMTEFRNDGILEFSVMRSSGQAGDDTVGNSKFEFKVKIKGAALASSVPDVRCR